LEDDLQGDEPLSTDSSGSIRTFKASPTDGAKSVPNPGELRAPRLRLFADFCSGRSAEVCGVCSGS